MTTVFLRCFIFIFAFGIHFKSLAQDPVSTQTSNNPVFFNPAFGGSDSSSIVSFGYRNQWPSLSSSYKTLQGSFSTYLGKLNAYTGLALQHDTQEDGIIQSSQLLAFYAQNFKIKEQLCLRPAVQLGVRSLFIDWSRLSFGNQIDPQTGFTVVEEPGKQTSYSKFRLNLGLSLFWKNLTFGVSAHNLEDQYQRFGAQVAYDWYPNKSDSSKTRIQPYAFYYYQQGFQTFFTGISVHHSFVFFGLAHRWNDAVIVQAGAKLKRFRITYSYDLTVSNLTNMVSGGGHELSLSYRFWKHKAHPKFLATPGVFE